MCDALLEICRIFISAWWSPIVDELRSAWVELVQILFLQMQNSTALGTSIRPRAANWHHDRVWKMKLFALFNLSLSLLVCLFSVPEFNSEPGNALFYSQVDMFHRQLRQLLQFYYPFPSSAFLGGSFFYLQGRSVPVLKAFLATFSSHLSSIVFYKSRIWVVPCIEFGQHLWHNERWFWDL